MLILFAMGLIREAEDLCSVFGKGLFVIIDLDLAKQCEKLQASGVWVHLEYPKSSRTLISVDGASATAVETPWCNISVKDYLSHVPNPKPLKIVR